MARKMADCRRFPSESNCSLTIIGEEEEVVQAAAEHAVSVHGHSGGEELKDQVRGMLEDEAEYQPGTRPQEPMPS
jgi:predicted small metal-binding protein